MKKNLLILMSFFISLDAQNLKLSVQEVLSSNPIILERLKNYNATKEDITIAKSGYYPKLDLSIAGGFEKSDKTIPDFSAESTVYQNSLKYTQNLFNGFQTTHQISASQMRTLSAAYSYIEKVNDTSFEMVNTYLQVMKNRELLQTAQANVNINNEIFIKVQKLYNAGLTTLSEVNKIESSLSLAKSNLVVQENTLLDVTYNMQRVLGRYLDVESMSKPKLDVLLPQTQEEATQFAMLNNPSLLVSNYNIQLSQERYKESQSSFYPHLDIEVSQSMNKNLSGIDGEDNRFRAMAYLSYNIFNGFSDSASLQKNISSIHQEVQTKNTLRRGVIEGLNLSWAAFKKLNEQLVHLYDYQKFSKKTLKLYSKEYDLGRRSLLDLLSAQNDFIGSKSQIINTEYSTLFAKYRILDAMGILVSTILDESDTTYSNVGLKGKVARKKDTLPIYFDQDNDLIVDDKDICNNSLTDSMKSHYGCIMNDKEIKSIERYSGFLFEDSDLRADAKKRLKNLIKQLTPYGVQNIKFDILANAQDEDISSKKLKELSTLRAQKVKDILLSAGALVANITIYSQANSAPLYSNDIEKNNRIDIVVKKLR